jgi:hypothetical protein
MIAVYHNDCYRYIHLPLADLRLSRGTRFGGLRYTRSARGAHRSAATRAKTRTRVPSGDVEGQSLCNFSRSIESVRRAHGQKRARENISDDK